MTETSQRLGPVRLMPGVTRGHTLCYLWAAFVSIGLFTYLTMPRESNPDIKVPFVAVIVPYPGVSPEDSERLLVRPLETALQYPITPQGALPAGGMAAVHDRWPRLIPLSAD